MQFMIESVTLDQLRILAAIADAGSFTAASKRLDRAQSAISHAMANLELQLDLQLFDRSQKKPRLTSAGEKILEEGRSILVRTERLKSIAKSLVKGVESNIVIASDTIVPPSPLFNALREFADQFSHVSVTLHREGIGSSPSYIMNEIAHIGFTGSLSLAPYEEDVFDRFSIGHAEVVAIAAPTHPLSRLRRPLLDRDLSDLRQLIPSSRVTPKYTNTLVHNVWAVADLQMRYDMIVAGIGWGTVPLVMARNDILSGKVIELKIKSRSRESMRVPLFGIVKTSTAIGPGARWLLEKVEENLKAFCHSKQYQR